MKCQQCRKQPASVFFKAVANNKVSERRLCGACAEQLGPFSLMDFLLKSPLRPARRGQGSKCGACGLPYADFRKASLLGCSECYKSFAPAMEELLPRLHGSARHRGRGYGRAGAPERLLEQRRKELGDAIGREQFERAAALRDEIRRLEGRE